MPGSLLEGNALRRGRMATRDAFRLAAQTHPVRIA
jgi:hypothetical protein